jgi:hypothetical protein
MTNNEVHSRDVGGEDDQGVAALLSMAKHSLHPDDARLFNELAGVCRKPRADSRTGTPSEAVAVSPASEAGESNDIAQLIRYRNYAEETRIIAGERLVLAQCYMLLEIAAGYDRMANAMDAIIESKRALTRQR